MNERDSSDHLELSGDLDPRRLGRRRFLQGVGALAGASAFTGTLSSGLVQAAVPTGASSFTPLAQGIRLADTRSSGNYPLSAQIGATTIRVSVAGQNGVPANASAVVCTVTAVNLGQPNFVTVFPTGIPLPTASNLNLVEPGAVNANLVTVKVGLNGTIDVYSFRAAHLIVDVLGYYTPADGPISAGRFVGLSTARRAIDTRPNNAADGSFTTVDVTGYVPGDASSVVINLTATEATGPSFFTALPVTATTAPSTSSLNVTAAGQTRAAGVIVPVSTDGGGRREIKIYTLYAAKLIVDITGYFTSDASPASQDGLFVPVDPVRMLDTREPGQIGKLWPNWVVEAVLPPAAEANAAAAVVNVTGVETRGPGFLTVSAARQPIPGTSNVNWTQANQVVPNHVITPVTDQYGISVFSSHGSHVIVDLAGYFTGTPKAPTVQAYVNPPPPAAPPPWTLTIPRLGLTSTVRDGDPRVVTDSGFTWHWTGTGFMGQEGAHVAIFGHRTEAGAPFNALDKMQNGDLFAVTTGDAREYTYRVVRRDLTDAQNQNILNACRAHPGTTLSLVACTVGYDSSKARYPDVWAPTSLKYRIIVTAELVSWRQV